MVLHRTQDAGTDNNVAGEIGPSEWNEQHIYDYPITLGKYTTNAASPASYDAIAFAKGLGICVVDMTGIDTIDAAIWYNKPTSTLEWQIWNQTDGTSIGTSQDATAAGDNRLHQFTISSVNLTGIKVLRLRYYALTNTGQAMTFYAAGLRLRNT